MSKHEQKLVRYLLPYTPSKTSLKNCNQTVSYPLNWIDTCRVISQNKHINNKQYVYQLIQANIDHRLYEHHYQTTQPIYSFIKIGFIITSHHIKLHHPTMIQSSIHKSHKINNASQFLLVSLYANAHDSGISKAAALARTIEISPSV